MNEAEKERLIRKDLVSIENKVRHAFNQGYEMGMKDREKLNCTDCIIEKSDDFIKSHTAMMMAKDALSRSEIPNKSEIPTSCGDAISRQAAIRAIKALQRPIMREESNYYQFKFSGMSEALDVVENLPSVTPQQKMGRWIDAEVLDKIREEIHATAEMHEDGDYYLRDEWIDEIIDKHLQEVDS